MPCYFCSFLFLDCQQTELILYLVYGTKASLPKFQKYTKLRLQFGSIEIQVFEYFHRKS
jgi:hypothetical protein